MHKQIQTHDRHLDLIKDAMEAKNTAYPRIVAALKRTDAKLDICPDERFWQRADSMRPRQEEEEKKKKEEKVLTIPLLCILSKCSCKIQDFTALAPGCRDPPAASRRRRESCNLHTSLSRPESAR